jgi:lipopolysaccharide/colanic/teichoic acid biosynthesis glycosyltransferase
MRVPSPTSRSGKRVYLSLWDLTWAVGSPLLALYLRDPEIFSRTDLSAIGYYWALAAGFAVLAFFAFKIHDNMTPYFSVHEAIDIVETVLFVELLTFVSLFSINHFDGIPRSIPLTHGVLLAAALFAARIFIRIVRGDDEAQPTFAYSGERIILIGANPVAGLFIRLLGACAPQRQHVIALLDADAAMIGRAIAGVQVVGNPQDLEAIVKEYAIHGVTVSRVVIAGEVDLLTPVVLHEVERFCQRQRINVSFLPRILGLTDRTRTDVAVASKPKEATPSIALPSYLRFRRPLDIVGSLVMLLLLSPLLAVAAVLVLIDVGLPVMFWQERVGWNGRSFLIYKFRTLASPFDANGNPLIGGREPSAIGRLLRVTRFDELPQLLNVLFGDMSLIGPRPLLPEDQPANAAIRLLVRPGISGWAQVNGGKLVSKEDKEKLDEWYVRNASLWLDLCIGVMTLKLFLPGQASHEEASADAHQVQLKNAPLMQTGAMPGVAAGEVHRRAS